MTAFKKKPVYCELMIAIEVTLNGERLCSAGVGTEGVLTAILSWVRRRGEDNEECRLEVGGMKSSAHVKWLQENLSVGDEVGIKILDRTEVDPPSVTEPFRPAEDLKKQQEYVRRMAEQFGWRISPAGPED